MSKKAARKASRPIAGKKKVARGAVKSKATPPASSLRAFFENSGVRFGVPSHKVLDSLEKRMGRDRFKRWQRISTDRHSGIANTDNEYAPFESAAELNTVFSLQAEVSLSVCTWLADQVARYGGPKSTIGDLGCGAGVLAGWLSRKFPRSSVLGFDAMPNVVRAAADSQKADDLSFHRWDYGVASYPLSNQCDVLVSCFGLDFPMGMRDLPRHSFDSPTLRGLPYYSTMNAWLRPVFRHWKTAIHDQGVAYIVLRIPDDVLFLATVDAAHQEGWSFSLDQYTTIHCGRERFPGMSFVATPSAVPAEEDLLAAWARVDLQRSFPALLKDTSAIAVFRALANKAISKSEVRTYDDGHSMKAVVGTAGGLGFQFTHATTGFARLKLMSAADALMFSPGFPEDGDLVDIDDCF